MKKHGLKGLRGTSAQHEAAFWPLVTRTRQALDAAEHATDCIRKQTYWTAAMTSFGKAAAEAKWVDAEDVQFVMGELSDRQGRDFGKLLRSPCLVSVYGLKGLKKRKTKCRVVKGRKVCKVKKRR